jgi:aryl-alcohol dehydrogenase-like predicted oxidoreductase
LKRRKLGNTDIEILPLVLGCASFGWSVDQNTSFALLDAFVAAGYDCIDTADVYSVWAPGNCGGESESIIGHWLKARGHRNKLIIATKVGWAISAERKGLSKAYILSSVEGSLKRLQTDYIDLYQSHVDDSETPLEETLSAFELLIQQGKVRIIGASNHGAARLREALDISARCGLPRYQTLQQRYNLCVPQTFETNLEPLCMKEGIAVLGYAALAGGFLTGKYRNKDDLDRGVRRRSVEPHFTPKGLRILAALDTISKLYNFTVAQVALAWVMTRPSIAAPIFGATNVDQLSELLIGTKIDLDQDALTLLESASKIDEMGAV